MFIDDLQRMFKKRGAEIGITDLLTETIDLSKRSV